MWQQLRDLHPMMIGTTTCYQSSIPARVDRGGLTLSPLRRKKSTRLSPGSWSRAILLPFTLIILACALWQTGRSPPCYELWQSLGSSLSQVGKETKVLAHEC